jgi:pentatricopeptide repeat protein
MQQMLSLETNPKPDIYTFNILLAAYGRDGACTEALELLQSMEGSGVQADAISYLAVFTAAAKTGNWPK